MARNTIFYRSLFFGLLMGLCLESTAFGQTQTAESAGPADTVKTFLTCLGNADLDGLMATFADDATVFLPLPIMPKRLSGRSQIGEAFAPFLENVRQSGKGPPYMVLNPQDWQLQEFETTAIVTFHLGKLPSGDSEAPTSFSRRTFVLQRIRGSWLIVHMHGSNILIQPGNKE